jgi:hypothetical protein
MVLFLKETELLHVMHQEIFLSIGKEAVSVVKGIEPELLVKDPVKYPAIAAGKVKYQETVLQQVEKEKFLGKEPVHQEIDL